MLLLNISFYLDAIKLSKGNENDRRKYSTRLSGILSRAEKIKEEMDNKKRIIIIIMKKNIIIIIIIMLMTIRKMKNRNHHNHPHHHTHQMKNHQTIIKRMYQHYHKFLRPISISENHHLEIDYHHQKLQL